MRKCAQNSLPENQYWTDSLQGVGLENAKPVGAYGRNSSVATHTPPIIALGIKRSALAFLSVTACNHSKRTLSLCSPVDVAHRRIPFDEFDHGKVFLYLV